MADSSPFVLRLSNAAQWVRCAAFVRMNRTEQAVELENAADHTIREEGTAIHEAAHWIFMGLEVSAGSKMSNGVVLTDEMIDAAESYVEVVSGFDGNMLAWSIERQLAAPRIHAQCGGTPDAFALYDTGPVHIRIVDLKGGYRPVEVFPNWQLFGYLAAVLDSSPLCYDFDEFIVEFTIVQPRCYHQRGPVRSHRMTIGEARPYIDALRMAAHIAMGEIARAIAGPQCDDCNGRASCSIAHAAGMRALEIAGEPDIHDLPAAALDYEMLRIEDAVQILNARLTGLQAQMMQQIRRGVTFSNYTVESGNGRLNWIDDKAEAAAIAMGDLLGANIRKPTVAITPTQAMKVLPVEMLEQYAQRKRGELKLVRFDSNAAVKAFSHLKKG